MHSRKSKKQPVAQRATPEQQVISCPPPASLKSLLTAGAVLEARHAGLKSWDVLSWELGGVERGTLSRVARGIREPSAELISKINGTYGCHVHAKTKRITITVCPVCGEMPEPKHKCKDASKPVVKHQLQPWNKFSLTLLAILNTGYKD